MIRSLFFPLLTLLTYLVFANFAFAANSKADSKAEAKVVYKYRSSESYDFSDMNIEGNLMAPGDLSLSGRDKKEFDYNYPTPKSFDKQILDDLEEIQ